MKKIILVLFLFFLPDVSFSNEMPEKEQSPLQLTLAVNEGAIGFDYDTVYVTLKNISDKPQNFIKPESSWGWDALTIKAMIDGQKVKLTKFQQDWKANTPGPRTLQPRESYIFAEHLLSWPWDGWPDTKQNLTNVKLQASYDTETLAWSKISETHLISNAQTVSVNLNNYCPPSSIGTFRDKDGKCSTNPNGSFNCDAKGKCTQNITTPTDEFRQYSSIWSMHLAGVLPTKICLPAYVVEKYLIASPRLKFTYLIISDKEKIDPKASLSLRELKVLSERNLDSATLNQKYDFCLTAGNDEGTSYNLKTWRQIP